MDTQEQEAYPHQNPAQTLDSLRGLHQQYHAEYQYGERVSRKLHFEAETGDNPRPCGGAQIGAEDDANTLGKTDQLCAQERDGNHRDQRG